ncbi:Rhamnogalacturonyl hydrolase YesR [Mariniphaga anaerophila]|uniref:Rhamnogalacturonyl hydrolase YesR n=1 Tax=Mariniphaga anaerophila TaxID=1484053 RepID=A0A1M4SW13_9BACT|nr:glycoside hydrolase family 88 protein [Mariniphaga anaerophila]SHE36410.1 Rhamnogalacturonyl hydrolase YesR [Mariniphaga anaerophila]
MKNVFIISIGFLLVNCQFQKTITSKEIISQIKRVADYELSHPSVHDYDLQHDFANGWIPSTFYVSLIPLYEATGDKKYLEEVKKWGNKTNWTCAPRLNHADDIVCGQVYLDLYRHERKNGYIENLVVRMDSVLQTARRGREEWHWCDALFMAPPVYTMAGKILNEPSYIQFSDSMYWDVYDYLFDHENSLFYRDDRFFTQRGPDDQKIFWGRGNGWVLGGLARLIPYVEDAAMKQRYIELFQQIAERIVIAQQADGLWRSDLLNPKHYPSKETSSSGFFVYSLAWGINNGYLSRADYQPIVEKGWLALNKCVNEETGMLGYVQPIGAAPDSTNENTTFSYGAGAFILAGIEMLELIE